MNKKVVTKLRMFFWGLVSRMEENRSYFIEMNLMFQSGTKPFPAKVTMDGKQIMLEYQAVKRSVDTIDDLCDFVEEEAAKYDSVRVEYLERGAKLVIDANEKDAKLRHEDPNTNTVPQKKTSQIGSRDYMVNPSMAKQLLTEIGIMAKNGKIKNDKIRKYNQIDYFVELMDNVLKEIKPTDELVIMDCACGKSYLSFVLNFYLRDMLKKKCHFICVDYSETVIHASKQIATNLGYQNMEFIREDLKTYTPNRKIDVIVSLHACDTATDMALAQGVKNKAKAIVCVPCCHKDILSQYEYPPFASFLKHGILKARLADTLTDGIRSVFLESVGYQVSMIEYISPLETPKNIMIRAVYTGKKNEKAKAEYENLKQMLHVNPAIEQFLL